MQSKKYQCYNINVQTLVSYATIETKFQIRQKPHKNPMPKTCQKSPKNPWQKSARIRRIFQGINKILTKKN